MSYTFIFYIDTDIDWNNDNTTRNQKLDEVSQHHSE